MPSAGLLGTSGGLLFAATAEGQLLALNADREASMELPHGIPITASPMSYAVDGKQFVAVAAGNMIYSFALPKEN